MKDYDNTQLNVFNQVIGYELDLINVENADVFEYADIVYGQVNIEMYGPMAEIFSFEELQLAEEEEEDTGSVSNQLFFIVVPILDLTAGFFNYDVWGSLTTVPSDWETAYIVQFAVGGSAAFFWLLSFAAKDILMIYSLFHILAEGAAIFFVSQAESSNPNTTDDSTSVSYGCHGAGIAISLIYFIMAAAGLDGTEEAEEDEQDADI